MFPGQAPSGFDDLIQRKYAQQQFGLDTQRLDALARSNLLNAQASAVAPTTAAQVEESKAKSGLFGKQGQEATARSGLYGAQAQGEAVRNQWYGPEAQARIGLDKSSTNLNNSNALQGPYNYSASSLDPAVVGAAYMKSMTQQNGDVAPLIVPGGGTPSSTSVNPGMVTQDDDGGHRMGTTRIAGRGDGTKDTVKTKLAPGEAVLNKAAADMIGRGLIAHANALGAKKMGLGMVAPTKANAGAPGYKRGTDNVGSKKAATTALDHYLSTGGSGGMLGAALVGPGMGLPGPGGGYPAGSPQGAPLAMGPGLMGAQPASRGRGMP